ncbi:MAG: hypothetical protein H7233_13250 [Pseudorhodobacter sp.]|nr:hypothetical protein [Frankiaceae bacterium]
MLKGPWKSVLDDDAHVYERGIPTAVCAKTFAILSGAPYAGMFELLEPAEPVDPETAPLFACGPTGQLPAPSTATSPARRVVTGMSTTASSDGACC